MGGWNKVFVCKGLHFIPARFVKSAEIVPAYQRGRKLKNCFACGRTYEKVIKIFSNFCLDLWSSQTPTYLGNSYNLAN